MAETEAKGNFWEEAPLTNLLGNGIWAAHAWLKNIEREDWRKLRVDKIFITDRYDDNAQDKRMPKYRLVKHDATTDELARIRLMEEYSYLPH